MAASTHRPRWTIPTRALALGFLVVALLIGVAAAPARAQVVVTDPISHINQLQQQITNIQNQANTYQLMLNDVQRVQRDLSNFARYGGAGAFGTIASDMGALTNDAATADPKAVPASLRATLNSQLGQATSLIQVLQARAGGAAGANQSLQVQAEYLNQIAGSLNRALQYEILKEQAQEDSAKPVAAPYKTRL